ncbi:DUF1295 domain-containing protein [Candidatus Saccharibacteria bacterium]|nr:DUF1295 domain-containing protein [Candidatus Saccharibacteria bacterium]
MFSSVAGRMFWCWLAAFTVMSLLFVVARQKRRYDVVDVGWGLSFVAIALTGYVLQPGNLLRFDPQALTTVLVMLWGLRLSWHITKRIVSTETEDRRYVELRQKWKGNETRNIYFRIYVVQSVLALLVSIPVVHINLAVDTSWSAWTMLGVVVWLFGYLAEVFADRQLAVFVASRSKKDTFANIGLWRYARHPNYFGEILMWWGIAIISLGTAYGWVGLGGAMLITYLIRYVSGVPLKEKHLAEKPGWEAYKTRTNRFIPLRKS